LALDGEGRITWVNQALLQMIGLSTDNLTGKTDKTLDPIYSGLFKGTGLMRLHAHDGQEERWLQCTEVTADDEQAPGKILKYFQDVTELTHLREENERLRQQVQELAITDELTGLSNRRALTNSLNAQVTRSRRYQNPLSLVALELVDSTRSPDQIDDDTILAASRYLRNRLRWVDIIGRWDHNQFFIILPETDETAGLELLNKIVAEFADDNDMTDNLSLHFGLAQWQKGCDSRKLMELAANAIQPFEASA
ncbi:MAG: diguanylate cyclase, partial [Chromatiales bacterium]|nr:diguanylate cyclase [Chromatiales bacterium]